MCTHEKQLTEVVLMSTTTCFHGKLKLMIFFLLFPENRLLTLKCQSLFSRKDTILFCLFFFFLDMFKFEDISMVRS